MLKLIIRPILRSVLLSDRIKIAIICDEGTYDLQKVSVQVSLRSSRRLTRGGIFSSHLVIFYRTSVTNAPVGYHKNIFYVMTGWESLVFIIAPFPQV